MCLLTYDLDVLSGHERVKPQKVNDRGKKIRKVVVKSYITSSLYFTRFTVTMLVELEDRY